MKSFLKISVLATVLVCAACSSTSTTAPTAALPSATTLQADASKALYFLQAAGCVVNAAGAAAAPVVQAVSDAKGNAVLSTVDSLSGKVCSVTVPATAVAAAVPAAS